MKKRLRLALLVQTAWEPEGDIQLYMSASSPMHSSKNDLKVSYRVVAISYSWKP
jgi:hypothetical protein